MPLDNCSRCGSLFKKISRDYCNTCYEEEEQLLRDTQAYLRDNRNASKAEVMSEMELDPETLEQWIESKRINEFDEAEAMGKRLCQYCGREVKGDFQLPIWFDGRLLCQYCGREVKGDQTICKTCQIKKLSGQPSKGPAPGAMESEVPQKKKSLGMHVKRR